MVHVINLDPRAEEISADKTPRPLPCERLRPIRVEDNPQHLLYVSAEVKQVEVQAMKELLRRNRDLFAWIATEMPGIDPNFCCHKLVVNWPTVRPVAQRKRRFNAEKQAANAEQVRELLQAGFIQELRYAEWLANPVLVHKSNGKRRMCVDYTNLNKVCPKDPFPIPNIDRLVDSSASFRTLSFLDAYSGYNQIPLYALDQEKNNFTHANWSISL